MKGPFFTIRPETPVDHEAIYAINRETFGQEDETRLVRAIHRSPNFIPSLSLVAQQDGAALVGHIMVSAIGIQGENGVIPALALAPLAVLPACQRQGIGGMLVREAIDRGSSLGHRIMVVLGIPTYYPRFGFHIASAYGIKCPYPVPDEAFMVMALQPGALNGVRGSVVYPVYFDEVS